MAKLNRERRLAERRLEKQAKKEARKQAAAEQAESQAGRRQAAGRAGQRRVTVTCTGPPRARSDPPLSRVPVEGAGHLGRLGPFGERSDLPVVPDHLSVD